MAAAASCLSPPPTRQRKQRPTSGVTTTACRARHRSERTVDDVVTRPVRAPSQRDGERRHAPDVEFPVVRHDRMLGHGRLSLPRVRPELRDRWHADPRAPCLLRRLRAPATAGVPRCARNLAAPDVRLRRSGTHGARIATVRERAQRPHDPDIRPARPTAQRARLRRGRHNPFAARASPTPVEPRHSRTLSAARGPASWTSPATCVARWIRRPAAPCGTTTTRLVTSTASRTPSAPCRPASTTCVGSARGGRMRMLEPGPSSAIRSAKPLPGPTRKGGRSPRLTTRSAAGCPAPNPRVPAPGRGARRRPLATSGDCSRRLASAIRNRSPTTASAASARARSRRTRATSTTTRTTRSARSTR